MAGFKPIAGPMPGVWKFPVDEEAEEWLRQNREEVPLMSLEDQLAWHTRFAEWYWSEMDADRS